MTFKSVMFILASITMVEGIKWLWRKRVAKDLVIQSSESPNPVTEVAPINEALFFPVSERPCRMFYNRGRCDEINCQFSHDDKVLSCLFQYLNMAKESVDICVYMITSPELRNQILKLHKRGVKIRIITDGNCGEEDRTQIKNFRSEGIFVRSNLPADRLVMHHKFTLVDRTLLINGSLNWTWQAITSNHENLMITNEAGFVSLYAQEFDRLWEKFLPSTQTGTLNFNQ